MELVSIVKSRECIFKVYDHTSDFQVIADNVAYRELWFTHHSYSLTSVESLEQCIKKFIDYNRLTDIEKIM